MDNFTELILRRCPHLAAELTAAPPTAEELEQQRAAQEARRRREEKCRRDIALRQFLQSRGSRYEDCRFSNYKISNDKQREAVSRLMSYSSDLATEAREGNGVVLFGPSGSGKDHLLTSLARVAILSHGFSVLWKSGAELFAEFREVVAGNRSEKQLAGDLIHAEILVLSDPLPPAGNVTDYQASMLFRVIDGRYNSRRPTWVSLNVKNSGEADARLGAAIVDRLRHGSLCMYCDWLTYRKKK